MSALYKSIGDVAGDLADPNFPRHTLKQGQLCLVVDKAAAGGAWWSAIVEPHEKPALVPPAFMTPAAPDQMTPFLRAHAGGGGPGPAPSATATGTAVEVTRTVVKTTTVEVSSSGRTTAPAATAPADGALYKSVGDVPGDLNDPNFPRHTLRTGQLCLVVDKAAQGGQWWLAFTEPHDKPALVPPAFMQPVAPDQMPPFLQARARDHAAAAARRTAEAAQVAAAFEPSALQLTLLSDVNRSRAQAGLRPVRLDPVKSRSCALHVTYMELNPATAGPGTGMGSHAEEPGKPGYTPEVCRRGAGPGEGGGEAKCRSCAGVVSFHCGDACRGSGGS